MATFVRRQGVSLSPRGGGSRNDRYNLALQKYRDRGWTIRDDYCVALDMWPDHPRRVLDGHGLCLARSPLVSHSFPPHDGLVDPSASNGFILSNGPEMECTLVTAPVLRFQYTLPGEYATLPKQVSHQLDWHWRRHRRMLERLPLEERQKKWICLKDRDSMFNNGTSSVIETQWQLDPDFTAQKDSVGRLLVVEDITDAILAASGLLEIFSFRRTCRLGRRATDSYTARAFSVNRSLLRFFDKPESFRSLQERTNTLISGSFALAVLDRTIYPDSDLDLYTHPGYAPTVAEWLSQEGYRLVRRHVAADGGAGGSGTKSHVELDWREKVVDNWRGITQLGILEPEDDIPFLEPYEHLSEMHAVYTWHKCKDDQVRVVQVMSCKTCPLACILTFHSTVVQNVISHRASYALYPKATFVSRIGVPLEAVNDRHARALEKYKDRGWTINADFMRDRIQEFQPQQKRRVGDAYSWCLPDLPRTGTSTSQENFPDPVAANSFVLTYDKLEMKCLVLSSPILRLQYMIAEEVSQEIVQSLDWHWRRHRRRLEQLPLEERVKQWIWYVLLVFAQLLHNTNMFAMITGRTHGCKKSL
ncbi:hypothetical protein HWV62_36235 [Athelia sp. TMB]|nr:hypothetical protein HWV62_36235 [Athelia sp. TMB]